MTSLPFEDPGPVRVNVSFDDFWKAYPRKVGKLSAEKAFKKARSNGAKVPDIMDGLRLYLKTKPAYADWCHPATWLNQGRWMDEPDTIDALKAGIVGGAFHGESLECIASNVKRAGTTWARYRYPRDVLEQCVAAELLTETEMESAL